MGKDRKLLKRILKRLNNQEKRRERAPCTDPERRRRRSNRTPSSSRSRSRSPINLEANIIEDVQLSDGKPKVYLYSDLSDHAMGKYIASNFIFRVVRDTLNTKVNNGTRYQF